MHSLLRRQIASIQGSKTDGAIDIDALMHVISRSYEEYDRERRLNDRAARLMEEELIEANKNLEQENIKAIEAIFQAIEESLFILSADGSIEGANPAAERLFGRTKSELIGRQAKDFISGLPARLGQANGSASRIRSFEAEFCSGSGEPLTIDVSISHFRYQRQEQFLTIIRNISEQRRREADLIAARETAIAANSAKSNFLASMSHELRTPLNAILGFAQIIRDQLMGSSNPARYADYAGDIYTSGQHLLSLIDDILDLSKIDSGRMAMGQESLDLVRIAEEAMTIVRAGAEKKRIALLLDKPLTGVKIMADMRGMKQVILNLLSNAIKFTPEDGEVTVRISVGGRILMSVRDTGIGIQREDLKNVFEPFHRGNSMISREYSGTGLGLAITKKLVEMHGGAIEIDSTPGIGTNVTVTLPLSLLDKSADQREIMGMRG